ncbi:NADH:flavin oxidoreductase [Streptomyces sp. NPDC005820]|uniref:NADH:flavin oxidoreductase n=1 Tax=Streptomyces sp. NPDC005820 TaxID=3157069 RepID=UPI0033D10E5E
MSENAEQTDILFTPLTINKVTLANRIVMAPMAALSPRLDGHPSEQTIAFLSERAKGGVGLIILGGSAATRRSWGEKPVKTGIRFDDDRFVPDLKRVTDAVHAHGTPIFAELMPGMGAMAKPSAAWPLIAASPKNIVIGRERLPKGMFSPADRVTGTPREATVEEIRRLTQEMAESAVRAQRAGFDGVEVPAMMNYFLTSFLSPRTNWRTDEYGGSVENRARVLADIVRLIREKVGPSFPIGLRITANEHVDGGQGPEGFADIARHVEPEGLDYVALTDGNYESMHFNISDTDTPTVAHGEAKIFREALSCPVIIGSIHGPENAAQAISEGHGDAVMLARQLLADPDYANKARNGRSQDIIRCDHHNHCMLRLALDFPVRCTVNPRTGRESRQPGSLPPVGRLVKSPIEKAVLTAAGSERFINLLGKFAKKQS